MRGLTIVLASADAGRLRLAVTLTSANAALGGRARLYFSDDAVPALSSADLTLARDSGVQIIACQTGLATAAMALPQGMDAGGPVSMLAELGDDRLVTL